jgi:hypothetical protein
MHVVCIWHFSIFRICFLSLSLAFTFHHYILINYNLIMILCRYVAVCFQVKVISDLQLCLICFHLLDEQVKANAKHPDMSKPSPSHHNLVIWAASINLCKPISMISSISRAYFLFYFP